MKLLPRLAGSLACLAASAMAFAYVWPDARDAAALFAAQDDPTLLSELQIRKAAAADPQLMDREIEAALKDGDTDLALRDRLRRRRSREDGLQDRGAHGSAFEGVEGLRGLSQVRKLR